MNAEKLEGRRKPRNRVRDAGPPRGDYPVAMASIMVDGGAEVMRQKAVWGESRAGGWFFMGEDGDSEWGDGMGHEIVRCAVQAFKGRDGGVDGGGAEHVDAELHEGGTCRFVGACDIRPVRDGLAVEVEVEEHGLQVGVDGDGRMSPRGFP